MIITHEKRRKNNKRKMVRTSVQVGSKGAQVKSKKIMKIDVQIGSLG
jgi:hypothetical protein